MALRRLSGMCGRYAAARSSQEIVEELLVEADHTGDPVRSVLVNPQHPPAGEADYNIAPSKNARVVLTSRPRPAATSGETAASEQALDPVRQLRLLTWGLVPGWAKDPKIGARMTNARAETVLDKPAYQRAARSRRCLVPADGWYEWQVSPTAVDAKGKPRKQPFYMHRPDGVPLTFAGLYEFWRDPALADDDPLRWLTTFTIITTSADPGLDRIHDRQPLVLDPEQWATWLDPDEHDADTVAGLLAYARPGRFAAHPVDRAVGNARRGGPDLVRPIGREQLEGVVDPETGEIHP